MFQVFQDTVRLFNVIVVADPSLSKEDPKIYQEALQKGFVLTPNIIANYSAPQLQQIINSIGLSSKQLNAGFHKSFEKVRTSSLAQLVFDQLLHYFTTYGATLYDSFDRDLVYVPVEELRIPDLTSVPILIIRGISQSEFRAKLIDLLGQEIAFSDSSLESIRKVLPYFTFTEDELKSIKNHEVRVLCYKLLEVVPRDPIEFLRLCLFTSVGSTLLIKSPELLTQVRGNPNFNVASYFKTYETRYGLRPLASVFYRFKPLFLAFRTNPYLKRTVNKLRRLAPKNHKPFEEDYLNQVTSIVRKGSLALSTLEEKLETTPFFRKCRLLTALRFYSKPHDYVTFRIRNGKLFVTDFNVVADVKLLQDAIAVVESSIVSDLRSHISGKTYLIPSFISYPLFTSEKQFLGNLPYGTKVILPPKVPMLLGVHWLNLSNDKYVDLDLSLIDYVKKIGWNGAFRSDKEGIYFSGDVTDAPPPDGAIEMFYCTPQESFTPKLLNLNFYNYYFVGEEVPFTFVLGTGVKFSTQLPQTYLMDPNLKLVSIQESISRHQVTLGIVNTVSPEQMQFTFLGGFSYSILNSARVGKLTSKVLTSLIDQTDCIPSLADFLRMAGARVITKPPETGEFVNLSPGVVSKTDFINLFCGEEL